MRTYELLDGDTPVKREVAPFQSERRLEQLLHEVPELLLEEDILLIGRQVGIETGTLDLLGVDKFGNVVVFELKKGDSGSGSASEGSILSQPQQYAQSLQWFSYDDLNDVYREYTTDVAPEEAASIATDSEDSLLDGFRARYSTTPKPEAFNQHQRMVIVSEEITDRTAANARYLRDEGLNLQCVEVQRFRLSDDDTTAPVLVASTVIDYDKKRVQPRDDGTLTYPEINHEIISRAFPAIEHVTRATAPDELFPSGIDVREPRMRSLHPDHPDAVRYTLRLKPLEKNHVRLSIDVTTRGLQVDEVDKDSLTDLLRANTSRFEDAGFEVDQTRNTFRIVSAHWDVDSVAEVREEAFLDEIADRYADLVKIGHEIMLDGV
jgi:hypothetical protein